MILRYKSRNKWMKGTNTSSFKDWEKGSCSIKGRFMITQKTGTWLTSYINSEYTIRRFTHSHSCYIFSIIFSLLIFENMFHGYFVFFIILQKCKWLLESWKN